MCCATAGSRTRLLVILIGFVSVLPFLGCGDAGKVPKGGKGNATFDEGPNVSQKTVKEFGKNDSQHGNIATEENEPSRMMGSPSDHKTVMMKRFGESASRGESRGGLPNAKAAVGGGEPQSRMSGEGGRNGRDDDFSSTVSTANPATDKKKEEKTKTKAPQVWHKDGRRPAFARVYVGDGNSLELVSLQVTVRIEGPRARTLVDHVFRNPHNRQLEGTFDYPLPTGASPSYFGMFVGQTRDTVPDRFVRQGTAPAIPQGTLASLTPDQVAKQINTADWGRLQEGRIVGKQKALETYEDIVRGRIDPALLEYAGGNTFSGRVFPIPARGYNRILIAYEELLPRIQDQLLYRYDLPDCKLAEIQFTLQADSAEAVDAKFVPEKAKKEEGGGRLVYNYTWKEQGPGGEVRFAFRPSRPQIQTISGQQGESGPRYVFARLRPDLKFQEAQPFAQHAVFLLDTSLSEHPDRFAVNMKLLRKILESDPGIKYFNILTFNIAGCWVEKRGWLQNTPSDREKAFRRLDGLVLEGATDLSAALDKIVQPGFEVQLGTPINVFLLSDGQITWGEPDVGTLVARFDSRSSFPTRFFCYRTGLGADNSELFEALTRRGGAVFNCFNEADLASAAEAHRNQCLQVERVSLAGGPEASDLLIADRRAAVYPDGEILVGARVQGAGSARFVVEGTFLGKRFAQEFPVDVSGASELAPRAWAEIAVGSLLALNDPKLDELAVAYCQEFGIASRVASYLVLENDAEYKRLNLQEERGKTIPGGGDLAQFLDKMWKQLGGMLSGREAWAQFLARVEPRIQFFTGRENTRVRQLLTVMEDGDFEPPESNLSGKIMQTKDVPPTYLSERERNPREVGIYLSEARRRNDARDPDGALQVLSSVIEEYPGRTDALRLVGYRLIDFKQSAQAVKLFEQVQRSRPFEPHSYRDLARSLEEAGKFGLAALQYEIILAGTWHNRFHQSIKTVAFEEYLRMMQEAVRRKDVSPKLKDYFGGQLERWAGQQQQSDLRVTISWNTDATDVDLWVIEPDGTKCYYQQQQTRNGGQLSSDQTQGYGPERYQVRKALAGTYTVIVHYYRANQNLLAGESHVNVTITRHAGTPQEATERRTVILKKQDEQVEVARLKF
jgi:hypothetical protein